ncbi:MAG: hypothetical protein ACM3O7_10515 [Acidobacteriota bacterium]
MDERLSRLEAKIDELVRALDRIESRLAILEADAAGQATTPSQVLPAEGGPREDEPTLVTHAANHVLPLMGRSFLVLAGAWLLRALTDAGTLPQTAGVALGLAYAVAWFVLAARSPRTARLGAEFHGVTAAIIVYPLLYEATTKFAVLAPPASVVILTVLTGLGLVIAWRRLLPALAWAVTLGGLSAAFASLVSTHAMELYAVFLVLLGVAAVWLSYERHWFGLRWITAAAADLVVVEMVSLVSRPEGPPEAYRSLSAPGVEAVAVGLLVAYLGTIAVRTLLRRRDVNVFEAVQTIAALVVGFGGAVSVAHALGSGGPSLGIAALLTAAASYAVAFAFVDRRLGSPLNCVFYTSLALVFTLAGSLLLTTGLGLAFAWSALAVTAAALGGGFDRVTLRVHAVLYLLAAAVASGFLSGVVAVFTRPLASPWGALTAPGWLTTGGAVVCYVVLAVTRRHPTARGPAQIPHLSAAVLAALGIGAALVLVLARPFVATTGFADPAVMATVRTVVLAGTALLLAALGPRAGLVELTWLVYPVIVAGGIKLLAQDLPQGRPATLVLAFVAYGVALMLSPRLLRHDHPDPPLHGSSPSS